MIQIYNLRINGDDVKWFENQTREAQIKFIYNRSKYSKEQIESELNGKNISCRVPKKVTKRDKNNGS